MTKFNKIVVKISEKNFFSQIKFQIFLTLILFFPLLSLSQTDCPKGYFGSPLDIKLYMSGNFAELRSNHFHSGIDIRTQGVVGKKILSIADGYVSRIKVSPWGFGNALYITHTNGYISVYAHLDGFVPEIEKYIKEKQYERREFAMNLYPNPDEFPLKKGELVAFSGNSGRSYGPHLHFEIRNKDDEPIDPLLCGFEITDNIKPEFKKLAIYPADDTSFVNSRNDKKILTVSGSNGSFTSNQTVTVHGSIYFGFEAYDYLNYVGSRNAINEVQLFVDDVLTYHHKIETFSFYDSRYINSFVDYEERLKGVRIQKTYVQPNNKLKIYKKAENNGVVVFNDNKTHNLKYVIKDSHGNASTLKFKVKSTKDIDKNIKYENIPTDYQMLMSYKNENVFMKDEIRIMVHKHCLYDNLYFKFSSTLYKGKAYSKLYSVHNENTPLHHPITISIDGKKVPPILRSKALIVRIDRKGRKHGAGGKWINGFITAQTKTFGKFYITTDQEAPKITPLNIYENANMSSKSAIEFKATDNLAGIKSYNGYIDGEWVLFKYDGKNSKFFYEFDEKVSRGKHKLVFQVEDEVGNIAEYKANFRN